MNTSNTEGVWIPVDKPGHKWHRGGIGSPPHAPPLLKTISLSALVTASLDATSLLDARLEQVEYQLMQIMRLADEPLTREQLLERLRELKSNVFGEQMALFE